eukprot:6492128-Amphidinium_carterae.1
MQPDLMNKWRIDATTQTIIFICYMSLKLHNRETMFFFVKNACQLPDASHESGPLDEGRDAFDQPQAHLVQPGMPSAV